MNRSVRHDILGSSRNASLRGAECRVVDGVSACFERDIDRATAQVPCTSDTLTFMSIVPDQLDSICCKTY